MFEKIAEKFFIDSKNIKYNIVSIDKLNFPSAFFFNLYRINTQLIFERTGITVIVLVFTWLQLRLIDFISLVLESKASLTEDKSDDQLIVFFRDFLKVILGIIGFLLLLKFCMIKIPNVQQA